MSAQQVRLYEQNKRQAEDALNAGDFQQAIRFAEVAKFHAHSRVLAAQAVRIKGNALRQHGQHQDAIAAFESALGFIADVPNGTGQLRGCIYRDLAMVYIDLLHGRPWFGPHIMRYTTKAKNCLDLSLRHFEHNEVERAITVGFHGRLEYTLGNKVAATTYYEEADEVLQRSDYCDDELDNLIWLLKVAPRRVYYRRIQILAEIIGQYHRKKEAALIFYTRGNKRLSRFVLRMYKKRTPRNN